MKKFFVVFLLLFMISFCEEKVNIKELFLNGEKYDGKVVIIEGEVIGEKIKKGDYYFINIKDINEDIAIGVFVEKKDTEKIENFGRYKVKGDILKIKGIYNLNCLKHYGERDIHAIEVEVISKGGKIHEEPELVKLLISFILLLLTIFVIRNYHKRTSPKR